MFLTVFKGQMFCNLARSVDCRQDQKILPVPGTNQNAVTEANVKEGA